MLQELRQVHRKLVARMPPWAAMVVLGGGVVFAGSALFADVDVHRSIGVVIVSRVVIFGPFVCVCMMAVRELVEEFCSKKGDNPQKPLT